MQSFIHLLNLSGERFLSVAWPMLWQSSVLIAALFALDFALRRRVRATVRYALWMLVLVKLLLPTSLSLPTSPGYWVPTPTVLDAALTIEPVRDPQPIRQLLPEVGSEYSQPAAAQVWNLTESQDQTGIAAESAPPLSLALLRWPAFIALSWLFGVAALLLLAVLRGRMAWRLVAGASAASPETSSLIAECAGRLGVRSRVRVRLTDAVPTPVVCGLFRPVILLPRELPSQLEVEQLRAVLLHELAHVHRGDLWLSQLQTALQILHFFNPLLWLANARIRRVREEAVDEMVLVALADAAEVYPETLLNLAKRTVQPPRLAFGLIGILESKSSLGHRIRLMLLRPWPQTARLGFNGIAALLLLAAVLLPMSCAKNKHSTADSPKPVEPPQVRLEVNFVELPVETINKLVPLDKRSPGNTNLWTSVLAPQQAQIVLGALKSSPDSVVHSTPEVTVPSGQQAHIGLTNFTPILAAPAEVDGPPGNMQYVSPPNAALPMGHAIDVTPVISADGRSIGLTMLPALKEFLGYDSATNIVVTNNSVRMAAQLPLPRIRIRQLVTRTSILDGQTVVLGGLLSDSMQQEAVQKITDKVPVLGDMWLVGRLFRSEGAAVPQRSLLIFVTATLATSNHIAQSLAGLASAGSTADGTVTRSPYPDDWREGTTHPIETVPGSIARTNRGRAALLQKLNTIVFEEVKFDHPLSEVVRLLQRETLLRDPERKGINFMIARADTPTVRSLPPIQATPGKNFDSSGGALLAGGVAIPGAPNPITGLPITASSTAQTEASDLDNIPIKLHLTFVPLIEVLNGIVKVSEQPIRFIVEDYAVLFSAKPKETQPLYTKFFMLDPTTFNVVFGTSELARAFFIGLGLDLSPPRAIFYKPSGMLMVHAALEELAIVERALQAINATPPQPGAAIQFFPTSGLVREWLSSSTSVWITSPPQATLYHLPGVTASSGQQAHIELTNYTSIFAPPVPLLFMATPKETQPLYTKYFKVDPHSFFQRLAGTVFGTNSYGLEGPSRDAVIEHESSLARACFIGLGLDLRPPTAIYYKPSGMLMVHATLNELALVEQALQAINATPPYIKIEAKFVEIRQDSARALGFNWQLGNLILSTTNILGSPSRDNSSGSLTGILTDPQFRVTLQALEKRNGTDIVSAPAVTTLSRRAARIEVTASTNIVVQGQTQTIQLGPSLEVLAEVSPDKTEIELTVNAAVVEFFGYHDPGPGDDRKMLRFRDGDWVEEPGPTTGPIPRIRVRKLKAIARIWDSQTLVLANPVEANGNPGQLKQLIVFVKSTIIDPSGNPIHTDAQMPFRKDSIPSQNGQGNR